MLETALTIGFLLTIASAGFLFVALAITLLRDR